MFGGLLKPVLSLAISMALVRVPQDKWQQRLDSLPTPEDRAVNMDLKGWSFQSRKSPKSGIQHTWYTLHCSDTSSNRTLLLLHGFNTDGAIFFNLSPLSQTHTLVAYNFPQSSTFYTGSMRDFKPVIDDFCAMTELDTVDLLGNSLGGIISLFYAANSDQVTVSSLILASTYVAGSTKDNVKMMRGMADKLLRYPDYKLFYLLSLGSRISDRLERRREEEADSALETVVIKRIDWYRQVLKMLYWHDGTADAGRIYCPVLVLHGGEDRLVPIEEAYATRGYIPHASAMFVDTAGHTLIHSQAAQCIEAIKSHFHRDGEPLAAARQ